MDRREAIAQLFAAGTAVGLINATPKAVSNGDDVALFVIECDAYLSADQSVRIRDTVVGALAGTPFENVKVLLFEKGLRLKALSRQGLLDITGQSEG